MALPAFFFAETDLSGPNPQTTIFRAPNTAVLSSDTLAAQGVTTSSRRPCFVRFRGEVFVVGCYSRPVYLPRRHPEWVLAGITPPDQRITVVPGAGSGGSSGVAICFVTYQHRAGGVLLAESNPSNTVQLTLTGSGRIWGNLKSVNVEPRVTHVAGYASVGGSNYRRAFLATYGVASYAENLPTNRLTIEGPSINYLVPAGVAFATEFAQRIWYAKTAEYPYRLWYSNAGEPQYVDLASFRDTLDRDEITAIHKVQGVLIVFTQKQAYVIRASGSQFIMDRLDSSVGCLSHFACLEIHNKLWFPSEDGIWIYDGAGFRFVMKDVRPYWLEDYKENQSALLDSFAVDDKIKKNYLLLSNRKLRPAFEDWNPGTVIYVGNYLNFEPTMGGSNEQPDWSLDVRHRFDQSAFYGFDNVMYFGSEDGILRAEDVLDPDDDGDVLAKPLVIDHGCLLFQEPGDDVEMGKKLEQLWAYVESEQNAWSLFVLMGDEWAERQYEPDNTLLSWKIDVAASALSQAIPDPVSGGFMAATYIPETVHNLGPEGVAGRGLAVRIRALSPVGMKYRGIGGAWAPGAGPRKEKQITRFDVSFDDGGGPVTLIENPPPAAAYGILSAGGQPFVVTLSNAALATYPVPVSYNWTGAHVETRSSPIASGLVGTPETFLPTPGLSTLVVTVTLSGIPITQTYYFMAS